MIMTVEELRKFVTTDESDELLTLRLEALEKTVQGITNNNFSRFMVDGVIKYPADVKMGVVDMLKWDLEYRDKAGVQSETISRHSVTYISQDKLNTDYGYPASKISFLKPYHRARFGQGVG